MTVCPKDKSPLKNVKVGLSDGKKCPACNGIWLPFETVKKLYDCQYIIVPSKHYHDNPPDFEYSSWDSKILCPDDKSLLKTYKFKGIEIDICQECSGLWLDRNELKKLTLKNDNFGSLFLGLMIRSFFELLAIK